uniref:Peptidase S1 domain-containing protein n=1 Tax=Anopheles atroparvus TaxID=41427 RepID=A0AAG5CU20_ANOAO
MALKGVQVLCAALLVFCVTQVLGLRVAEQKCQEYIKSIASLNPIPVERTNEFVTQANGVPAKEAEFPHHVRVGQWAYEDYDDPGFIIRCSGALISEQYILLSGHCFWATGDDYVSLGRHDYTKNASLPEVQIKRVRKEDLIMHEGYDPDIKSSYDDIALLRLSEPVNFTSHIYPACLWTDESPLQLDKFTATAFTMGKFVNETDDTYVAKLLVQVVPSDDCAQEYANSTFYKKGITEEQICVQSPVEWNSTCEGDIGGLLQTLVEGSTTVYRLYGVEGNGHACEENHLKFTYTKVQSYLDWIEKIVWGA